MLENKSKKEGKFEYITQEAGSYKVCFNVLDNEPKVLSFDFSSDKKGDTVAATSGIITSNSNKLRLILK